jgi:hypothetical protein
VTALLQKNRYKSEPKSKQSKEMPRRILINTKYGGFSLSQPAQDLYRELTKDIERHPIWFVDEDVRRDDPFLLQVMDTLGLKAASGSFSALGFVEIPDDVPEDGWTIKDYDGIEWVAEKHRTWRHSPSQIESGSNMSQQGRPDTLPS